MKTTLPMILNELYGFGPATIKKLIKLSEIPDSNNEIYDWLSTCKYKGIKLRTIPSKEEIGIACAKIEDIVLKSQEKGIGIISLMDERYPALLMNIDDPPTALFYKGNYKAILNKKTVAIIGTRNPSDKGKSVAFRFGQIFAEKDYTIVSGLAVGCDSFAHKGCLSSNGDTIAVLPCGLDMVVPASNKNLSDEIIKNNGCLVSEYPIGTKPINAYYVRRDRIQSGLSQIVLVAETTLDSGTINTMNFALKYKRKLACYNHPIELRNIEQAEGNQKYIKEGLAISINNYKDLDLIINNKENCIEQIRFF